MTAVAMGFHDNGQPHRMRGFIRQDDLQRIASRGYILIIAATCIASCLSCFGLWWWGATGWNQAQTAYDALGAADARVRIAEAKASEVKQRQIDYLQMVVSRTRDAVKLGTPLAYAPVMAAMADYALQHPGDDAGAGKMLLRMIDEVSHAGLGSTAEPAASTEPDARPRNE